MPLLSVIPPDGWRLFGPSDVDRASQLEAIEDADYADLLRGQAELAGPTAVVLYDATHPAPSGIGAVVWLDVDPGANDLLGTMESIEAELAAKTTLTDVVVQYVDRPAGDSARLVAHAAT